MNCKGIEFFQLSNEILTRGSRLRFQARGRSMHPFIRDGDILEIEPVDGGEIRRGDVIFYQVAENHLVAHRVIKKFFHNGKPIFLTKGDSSNTDEGEKVYLEQILGRVQAIERKERRVHINQGWNRLGYIIYARISPFLIKLRRIGARLLPHIQGLKTYRYLAKRLIKPEVLYQWESSEDSGGNLLCKKKGKVIASVNISNFVENDSSYQGWWIFGMWVKWCYRGIGIGRKLTEMVCDFAQSEGARQVKLLVFEDNKGAISCYHKSGFYEISIPHLDEELKKEAQETRRKRIIMAKDI